MLELEVDNLKRVIGKALSSGGDFAEIFLEDKDELNIKCSGGTISGVTTVRIKGAGIYVLYGRNSVYVYTNNLSLQSLTGCAERAGELLGALRRRSGDMDGKKLSMQKTVNPNRFEIYPSSVDLREKIRVVRETDLAARNAGETIRQLNVDYFDTDQKVVIFNSED